MVLHVPSRRFECLLCGRALTAWQAGGTESCIHPVPVAGFARMRALCVRYDSPATASCPFDEDRSGFVMGEARFPRHACDVPSPCRRVAAILRLVCAKWGNGVSVCPKVKANQVCPHKIKMRWSLQSKNVKETWMQKETRNRTGLSALTGRN